MIARAARTSRGRLAGARGVRFSGGGLDPLSPILFTIPGLAWEVSAYGFFVALALVSGWVLAIRRAAQDGLPADRLGGSYVVAVAFGLLGARAMWLLQHPDAYDGAISLLALRSGELSTGAGVTIALAITLLHCRRFGVPLLAWLDALAPAIALAVALEGVGALLAGVGYGAYAPQAPWALRFPEGSPPYLAHRRELSQLLPPGASRSLPVYPTQVIAMLGGVSALAVWWWQRGRRRVAGQLACVVAIVLVAVRSFVEEPLRADRAAAAIGPLARGQVLAVIAVLALALWLRARLRAATPVATPAPARKPRGRR